jgi:hypothetical protein
MAADDALSNAMGPDQAREIVPREQGFDHGGLGRRLLDLER